MKRFFIARHGETQWNRTRRLQGQLDSPLTIKGRNQAKALGQKLTDKNISTIYSSSIGRAKETAHIMSRYIKGGRVVCNDQLCERDFGDWQGLNFDGLSTAENFHKIFFQLTNHAPPNGESAIDCVKRVKQALMHIAHTDKDDDFVVVTHGDVIRTLLLDLGLSAQIDAYSRVGNGSLFCLSYCLVAQRFNIAHPTLRL